MTPQYFDIALYNASVEATIASVNTFLQHYGAPTNLVTTFQASINKLQLELGVPNNPLKYPFEVLGDLTTGSWIKPLWEQIVSYGIMLESSYPTLKFPQQHNKYIIIKLRDTYNLENV